MMPKENFNVEEHIMYYIKRWDRLSKTTHFGISLLGSVAVICGFFVSIFLATDLNIPCWIIKCSSFLSSISIGILTSFKMSENRNKYRAAWRILNAKYLLYKIGKIDSEELISWYEKAESFIGDLNFSLYSLSQKEESGLK